MVSWRFTCAVLSVSFKNFSLSTMFLWVSFGASSAEGCVALGALAGVWVEGPADSRCLNPSLPIPASSRRPPSPPPALLASGDCPAAPASVPGSLLSFSLTPPGDESVLPGGAAPGCQSLWRGRSLGWVRGGVQGIQQCEWRPRPEPGRAPGTPLQRAGWPHHPPPLLEPSWSAVSWTKATSD